MMTIRRDQVFWGVLILAALVGWMLWSGDQVGDLAAGSTPDFAEQIRAHKIVRGMSQSDVRRSRGEPARAEAATGWWGRSETWYWDMGPYRKVVFNDGEVTRFYERDTR